MPPQPVAVPAPGGVVAVVGVSVIVPAHVLSAFQLDGVSGEPLGRAWGRGARFGRVVLSRATETSAWSGKVREKMAPQPVLLRVSHPVRSTDGRLVVGGYTAGEFVAGRTRARIDELMAAALAYDDAVRGVAAPPSLRDDVNGRADRAVWQGYEPAPDDVVAHLDFGARVLFDGDAPPALTELSPSAGLRPRGYTAALVMVDGLLAGAVDNAVVDRWAHVPGLRALAKRALEYREAAGPELEANTGSNLERVRAVVSG